MIETITPPATALVNLDTVKSHLGVTGDETDVILSDLILRASAAVTSFVGRPLLVGGYRETFRPMHPEASMMLSRWPVASVTSITVGGNTLAASDYEAGDDGLLLRLTDKGRYQCWAPDVTVVEYTAGFSEAHADVQAATLSIIADAWAARGRDPGMKSIGIGSISLAYFDGANRDPLMAVRSLLEPYRAPAIG